MCQLVAYIMTIQNDGHVWRHCMSMIKKGSGLHRRLETQEKGGRNAMVGVWSAASEGDG